MSKDLISNATRSGFREVLTGYVLREIDMLFEAGGLTLRERCQPSVGGQRRGLVKSYYVNMDFSSATGIRKVLITYEEIVEGMHRAQDAAPNDTLRATIASLLRRMERDGFRYQNGHFVSDTLNDAIVHAASLVQLMEASIQEHVDKARQKTVNGNQAGAIANTYSLVEEFLKQLLRTTGTTFNEREGDIRALYRAVALPLHLDPRGESLEHYLREILEGLRRQIGGLVEVANKSSDRQARKYNAAPHHAQLAANASFTLCEFLLESFEYQYKQKDRRAS